MSSTATLNAVPHIVVTPPGPKSVEMHTRAARYMKGYSSQVRLFPVVFESGHGVTLTDVDGNVYLDFSSGIYVTGLGHCHPKVTEAVQKAAGELMNAHDFTTPIKMRLLEKMAEIAPGIGAKKLTGMQFYDSGTTAVEAGLRVMRPRRLARTAVLLVWVPLMAYPWKRHAPRWAGWRGVEIRDRMARVPDGAHFDPSSLTAGRARELAKLYHLH